MHGDDVMSIATDFWEYRLMNNPTSATYLGSNAYNDRMESYDINQFNVSRVSLCDPPNENIELFDQNVTAYDYNDCLLMSNNNRENFFSIDTDK